METQPKFKAKDIRQDDLQRSIYEAQVAEDDLWFLPGPSDETENGLFPRADRLLLINPQDWHRAEAALAPQLARAAAALAALDQYCRDRSAGAVERLAMIEVEAMLWAQGVRVRREQIGAYLSGAGGSSAAPCGLGIYETAS